MRRALGLRIFFTLVCLAPFAWLLAWIAIGEASPETILHPDLRRFYEERHETVDWIGLWIIRVLFLFLLGLGLRRYLFKVRGVPTSLVTGLLLLATTGGYFLAITSYQTAETRLAFHPYFSAAPASIYLETVSLWLVPFLLVVGLIVGVAPLWEIDGDHTRVSDR